MSLRRCFIAIAALCLLAQTPARANGAMGLVLATFSWGPWLLYVAVTVAYEAWAFGRLLKVPWKRALSRSLAANALTACVGGCISGVLAYPFLGLFGSRLNPNPLGQTVFLLVAFGLVSAVVEAYLWVNAGAEFPKPGWLVARSCLIHVAGVPLALVILLAPARPYPGLKTQVVGERFVWLVRGAVRPALRDYIAEHERVPPVRTYGELLELLRPELGRFSNDRDLWAAAYWPDYARFDTGERRRGPAVEWNTDSRRLEQVLRGDRRGPVWLTRVRADGWSTGLTLEGYDVHATSDPVDLGYGDATKAPPAAPAK